MLKKILFLSISTVLFTAPLGHSHPHVFMNVDIGVVFCEQGIDGFKIKYTLDPMYSQGLISEFDTDQNKIFDEQESSVLYTKAFVNLRRFSYFIFVQLEDKNIEHGSVSDFKASVVDGQLVYSFSLNTKIKLNKVDNFIKVSAYDPNYFLSTTINKETVEFISAKNWSINHLVGEDKSQTFYQGQIHPEALVAHIKGR